MAIRTALTLDENQLSRMVRFIRANAEALEGARVQWLTERQRHEQEWNDDFTARAGESAVFSKSNETLNMVGSGVDFIRSRLTEDIFGSRPYFAADPENTAGSDPDLAEQIRRHFGWKLGPRQIDFSAVGDELIALACKYGECVAKVTHVSEVEEYEEIASVLHENGQPVTGQDGEFVFEADGVETVKAEDGTPVVTPKRRPDLTLGFADPVTGQPQLNGGFEWREQVVTRKAKGYIGARVRPLHFKEFLCPLNARDIHESKFVGHMTSMRLSTLKAHLGLSGKDDGEEAPAEKGSIDGFLKQAVERIKQETSKPKAEGDKPTGAEIEEPEIPDADPEFRLLEAYFEFDARETGRPQRIFCMVAYDYDLPLFWEYLRNVTPEGRYPFQVVRLLPEEGRWYGISWFRKYQTFQNLIDRLLNQIIYRNDLAANPVKFRRKEAVVQWQDDQPFEMHPDKVLDLNDGFSAEDALQMQEIPLLDQQTQFLLETVVSNWRMRSGVTTATQGSFGDMPSENTATGVNRITASGNTMFTPLALRAKAGLEKLLQLTADHQYAYQDFDETFTYLEGDAELVGQLNAQSIEGLKLNVRLTLTNLHQAEVVEKNQQAIELFTNFLAIPAPFQPVAAPLFSNVYKALGIDNTQDYFERATQINQELAALAAQQANDETTGAGAGTSREAAGGAGGNGGGAGAAG